MRYAIVLDGTVVNIALAAAPISDNWILIDGLHPMPGIGWTYANGVFAEA